MHSFPYLSSVIQKSELLDVVSLEQHLKYSYGNINPFLAINKISNVTEIRKFSCILFS